MKTEKELHVNSYILDNVDIIEPGNRALWRGVALHCTNSWSEFLAGGGIFGGLFKGLTCLFFAPSFVCGGKKKNSQFHCAAEITSE